MFDTENFGSVVYDAETSTSALPVPVGAYTAVVQSFQAQTVEVKGESQPVLDVTWEILDDLQAGTRPLVYQRVWLDVLPSGALDMGPGMNVGLGCLREGLKQNTPKKPWSPNMMIGQSACIVVTHRVGDDGRVFAKVKSIRPL